MSKVNIKIGNRGWVLEQLAADICAYSDDIRYSEDVVPGAALQYYVNYRGWHGRQSDIEVGYFTHKEEDPIARLEFFRNASEMDHCVCHSQRYADELLNHGVKNVSVISPGIDLDHFKPKVRIGVVGRTYGTGRKGEGLVEQVMDIDGIEWHFTGKGWPGEALNLAYDRMPDFYNAIDYILVPALYEGGPMCVVEGLACGKEIIASDVGWVRDFPHIPFERGDAASLRAVLEGLVAKRHKLRKSVLAYTRQAWAEAHIDLFERLLGERLSRKSGIGLMKLSSPKAGDLDGFGAELVLGREENGVRGGPYIRVPKTVDTMKEMGFRANLGWSTEPGYQVTHLFNLFPFQNLTENIEHARRKGNKVVLSPIFLNCTTARIYTVLVPKIFEGLIESEIDVSMAEIAKHINEVENLPLHEPYDNYHADVRERVDQADCAILLSEYERKCLHAIGALRHTPSFIVRNPVMPNRFETGDVSLVADLIGTDRYFIQIGRIEARKNQILLAECARRMGVTAVFVGHCVEPEYAEVVKKVAGENGVFLGRIEQDDPLFGALLTNAAALCMPSWTEGAPIAALEAASCGMNMILSSLSGEHEYFGDHATYVNPADLPGMMAAMETALTRDPGTRNDALAALVSERFSYERHVSDTLEVYRQVLGIGRIDRLAS